MKRYRKMTTAQLDELLQAELRKDTPDEEVVLPILEILENRERKPQRKNRWLTSAAAVAAVFALLIAVLPKAVGANSFWDAVLYMTDSFVQFFAQGDSPDTTEEACSFETDNPGLQQLYDQVVAMGVTDSIVPMWLPDGYVLTELKVSHLGKYEKIMAVYKRDAESIVIVYKISAEITETQYEHVRKQVEVYEKGRVSHAITENNDNWTVTWVRDNVECLIATVGVEKEDLYSIIQSIYDRS